jgi:hypothetical protein
MTIMQHAISIVIAVLFAAHLDASTEFIGALLLDGVKITENVNVYKDDNDGRWFAADIAFLPDGSLTIFKAPITLQGLPTAARVSAKAKQDGIGVILSGRINNLHISGWIYHSAKWGRQIWIEPHKLTHTEIGRVTSGLQPIAGGTMDLKGSLVWIENLTNFFAKREGVEGTFEITAWNRILQSAQLSFAGGGQATATLAPPNEENVTLHVDMSNGTAKLWDASLAAKNIPITGKGITIGLMTLGMPQLTAKRVAIVAKGGALTTNLTTVGGGVQTADLRTGSLDFSSGVGQVSWDTGAAQGEHDTKAATFDVLDIQGGSLRATKARLSASDQTIVSGAISASQVALSREALKGTFDWDRPDMPFVSFLVASGAGQHLTFALDGKWDQPFILSGALDAASFLVGGLSFVLPAHFAFPSTSTSQDIIVPIKIDVGDQKGRLEVLDGAHTAVITAELRKLFLEASCVITPSNLPDTHLDIMPHKLQLEVASAVSTSPWLGSAKPMFAGASIKADNFNEVNVSLKTQKGLVLIDSDVLAIGDPVVQVGQARPFRARTTLNASGGATLAYCMNRGNLVLTRGAFHAADAQFKSLDTGAVVDLGGTMLTDPDGSISDLSIAIDRVNNKGSVSSGAVKLGGSHVSRPRDPQKPNDMAFDGNIQGQLSIVSLEGTPEFTADRIDMTNIAVRKFGVAITAATLDVSQSMSLMDATLTIAGDQIVSTVELKTTDSNTPSPIVPKYLQLKSLEDVCNPLSKDEDDDKTTRREYFTSVSFDASGKLRIDGGVGNDIDVHLAKAPSITNAHITVSGRTDRLNGQGSAQFGGYAGSIGSAIMTDANCEGGHLLRIPMNTLLATGGTSLKITLVDGKSDARGSFAGLAMEMNSTGKAECEGAWHKQVLIAATSGWTEGICPTWSEPFRHCRWTWETPEVSYEYRTKAVVRLLTATVVMTNPYVEFAEKKTLLCNVGPASVAPIAIIGGYYPEFRGTIPVVSDVANALVGLVAETAESAIATALGTGIGGLASSLLSDPILGPVACIGMGIWK